MEHTKLSRTDASAAVTGLGWRYVLGEFRTEVQTGSLPLAADVAGRAAAVPGAEGHLRMDVRADRVVFSLQTATAAWVTTRDVELARLISAVAEEFRLTTRPGRVQVIEIGIDAMDIPAIRPFWRAVLGYDEVGAEDVFDPLRRGPTFWFQQMDTPRPQRNRIHIDVYLPHDQIEGRIAAAVAAGGRVISDKNAPGWWTLADPEGNEVDLAIWMAD